MSLEIDGIRITDEAQAEAWLAQGFINNDEFDNVSRQFKKDGLLIKIGDTVEQNSPTTFMGRVVKKVKETLKL